MIQQGGVSGVRGEHLVHVWFYLMRLAEGL